MAVVFYYTLDYAKETIFSSMIHLLNSAVNGVPPNPEALEETIVHVDYITSLVLGGMIIFAILIAVLAAYITLKPARVALSMQKRFVSSVAHELRNPLASLRTSNEVALYDLEVDSPLRETINENIETTIHLTKVLNNLLIFTRIDNAETIAFETLNLNETIETVVRKLQKMSDLKNVRITTSLTPDCMVTGNKTAIEQALYNVTKNAINYSKSSEAFVHLQTVKRKGSAMVIISDNGTGIHSRDLTHVFSPFYRAGEDREADTNGSMGLGLALVYEVMKLHHGTISVQSEVDKGTTVTLTFNRPLPNSRSVDNNFSNPDTIEYNFRKM